MSTSTLSTLAQLEATLKLDLMTTIGAPVMTLLESTNTIAQSLAANETPSAAQITVAIAQENAAWMTFLANSLGALPNLGAQAVSTLSQFALGKLQTQLPPAAATAAK